MYRAYFEAAAAFLGRQGIKAEICLGHPVSETDVTELSARLGLRVPANVTHFLRELGDGFSFQWELGGLHGSGELFDFGLSPLEDIQEEHRWTQQQLQATALEAS